jgi:NADPH:quinone reductase-like Zn-dependent oxidoreductase
MQAAFVEAFDAADPVSALRVDERPDPVAPDGWTIVAVRAASLNRHDLWSLQGVGLSAQALPMTLGCDAAGVDPDGNEVIVHSVVTDQQGGSLLSERYQGTFAERVAVPAANLIPKPAGLSFEEAACLPTAWLTAYQMLFTRAQLRPGETVLVQGASGGLATALVQLGSAAGLRVWVTTRDESKGEFAQQLGAAAVFASGARLPDRVDAVMDSVGAATWEHSLKCLRPGGIMVVSGGTSGYTAQVDVARVFALQLRIAGSSMGTQDDLRRVAALCAGHDIKPRIAHRLPLAEAKVGFEQMWSGELSGKVVFVNE